MCRRAQLRDCLEVLRQHVLLPDKLTTLALLQSAKKYIEVSRSILELGWQGCSEGKYIFSDNWDPYASCVLMVYVWYVHSDIHVSTLNWTFQLHNFVWPNKNTV